MWLTRGVDYGLIRPVARIAQSVEQGIENPRVLGSIPSPGTTIQRTRPKGGFLRFWGSGRFLVEMLADAPALLLPFSMNISLERPYPSGHSAAACQASNNYPHHLQPLASFINTS